MRLHATDPKTRPWVRSHSNVHEEARIIWGCYRQLIGNLYRDVGLEQDRSHDDYDCCVAPRLSVYVPLLIAESFGIRDSDLRLKASLANVYLDHFTQILDDSTDRMDKAGGAHLHLSHHLLAKGFAGYLDLCRRPRECSRQLNIFFDEAMRAERHLWRHHGRILQYDEIDLAVIGQRCALAKSSPAIFADLTDKWELLEPIGKGFDAISTGIQLVDDLFDWEDDLRSGIITHPLALVSRGYRSLEEFQKVDAKLVEDNLFARGVGDKVLVLAQQYIENGRVFLDAVRAYSMVKLIDGLFTNVSILRKCIAELSAESNSRNPSCSMTESLRQRVDIKLLH